MRTLILLLALGSALEWQKYCVDTVCNRCRSYLVRTMDENAKHYRRCLAITINPQCCQFETNLHFNVFPTQNPCSEKDPDSKIVKSHITEVKMCSEESVTLNLTVATEPEIDDFFANFESETITDEKLAKFQEPRNTITIDSKECLISFNEYDTCRNIRSKSTSNKIFAVVKYVVISLCSCAFGVLLVHFLKWSKSDSLRRQSNFVERQRSQVQSPSLAHSATLNSVDVRSASSPSEKDALTKHV